MFTLHSFYFVSFQLLESMKGSASHILRLQFRQLFHPTTDSMLFSQVHTDKKQAVRKLYEDWMLYTVAVVEFTLRQGSKLLNGAVQSMIVEGKLDVPTELRQLFDGRTANSSIDVPSMSSVEDALKHPVRFSHMLRNTVNVFIANFAGRRQRSSWQDSVADADEEVDELKKFSADKELYSPALASSIVDNLLDHPLSQLLFSSTRNAKKSGRSVKGAMSSQPVPMLKESINMRTVAEKLRSTYKPLIETNAVSSGC
jgi:hypothetical protein